MHRQPVISRSSLSFVGLALIGLFVPACDSATNERSLAEAQAEEDASKHDDCGCKPDHKPGHKPDHKPGHKPGHEPGHEPACARSGHWGP